MYHSLPLQLLRPCVAQFSHRYRVHYVIQTEMRNRGLHYLVHRFLHHQSSWSQYHIKKPCNYYFVASWVDITEVYLFIFNLKSPG